jgi:IMP dehydrogenase/GMP reductase
MASLRNQEKWKNGLKKGTCAEGKVIYLDIGEPVEDLIERYSGALRSGITYAGANDIKSFHEKVSFVRFV